MITFILIIFLYNLNNLAYMILGADKSQICKAGHQARNSQARMDAEVYNWNFFFLRKISLSVLRPFT